MPATEKNPLLNVLKTMKVRMDELYTESFGETPMGDPSAEFQPDTWQPLMDVWESKEEWLLVLDLPGVLDEDLHVEVKEDRLTVWGERCTASVADTYQCLQAERRNGTFFRAVQLPRDIESESIKAEFRRGTLTITAPRRADSVPTPHRIKVHRT